MGDRDIYVHYSEKDDRILVKSPYAKKHIVSGLPDARWYKSLNRWVYPTGSIIDIAQEFPTDETEFSDEALELLKEERAKLELADKIKKKEVDTLAGSDFLMEHQKVAVSLAEIYDRYALFMDTGTGKTIAGLDIINQKGGKWVVICPKSIINLGWREDQQEFYPDIKLYPDKAGLLKSDMIAIAESWGVDSSGRKATLEERLKSQADVLVINPSRFVGRVGEYKDYNPVGLIIDESTMIKNISAKRTKIITKFAYDLKHRYILTGKPDPRSRMDFFAQMRVVDRSLFGGSFYKFRDKYFNSDYMGWNWEPRRGSVEEISQRVSRKAYIVSKDECLDLPPTTKLYREVELSRDVMKHYKDMYKHNILMLEDDTVPALQKTSVLMKLRQITSGFVINTEEEKIVDLKDKSKINELLDVLYEIGDEPVVVWANFVEEIRAVVKELRDNDYTVATAYGETDDVDAEVRRFQDNEAQVLVANPATLKYGVTLTGRNMTKNCTYAVYLSLNYDYEAFYQSKDRIIRKGQDEKTTLIFIVAKDTIDEDIKENLEHKGTMSDLTARIIKRGN